MYLAEENKVLWAIMDQEKDYDGVGREALWSVMRLYGVDGNMV